MKFSKNTNLKNNERANEGTVLESRTLPQKPDGRMHNEVCI